MSYENIPKNADETKVLVEASDFFVEVARGNIPGHTLRGFVSTNRSVGLTFEDVWGGALDLVYPTAGETWELVSADLNDASAGTGARTVLVISMDTNYNENQQIVTLNGTTPVALTGSDHFKPVLAVVLTAGSGEENAGIITLQVSGAGAERNIIPAGDVLSVDGHFTVPAGKTLFFRQVVTYLPKNVDGDVRVRTKSNAPDAAWVTAGDLPYYQNNFALPIMALISVPEKTDVNIQARLSSAGGRVQQITEFLLVDN